jgi:hypothetical protein
MGNGKYEQMSSQSVTADLCNEGFAPGLASQITADHERISTTRAKSPKSGEKQPSIPTSMVWELPDSGACM